MALNIITDSTADLPAHFAENNSVKVVPLNIHIRNEVFRDGIDISNSDYYSLLRREKIFPLTSQPSSGDFLNIYENLQNNDDALVLLISSQLSGTIQSAQLASDMMDNKDIRIEIIDSLSTTTGLAFQVIKACELKKAGKNIDEIKAEIGKIRDQLKIFFVVDDLEYLSRGGRISHISKLIGSILQIKPVLCINKGKIEVFEKIRTRKKAVERIIFELNNYENLQKLAVIHVDALDEALLLHDKIKEFFPGKILINEVGPVIGTHTGPGSLGLVFY
jgi:DegV family protein with EDD domain